MEAEAYINIPSEINFSTYSPGCKHAAETLQTGEADGRQAYYCDKPRFCSPTRT